MPTWQGINKSYYMCHNTSRWEAVTTINGYYYQTSPEWLKGGSRSHTVVCHIFRLHGKRSPVSSTFVFDHTAILASILMIFRT